MYQEKRLKGSYYGGAHPQSDMPRPLQLYRAGKLPIDRLISRRYRLEQVNEAYDALLAGEPPLSADPGLSCSTDPGWARWPAPT